MVASGLRIGTPAVTTRGMGLEEMDLIGDLIARALDAREDEGTLAEIKGQVVEFADAFPLYAKRLGAASA